MKKIKFLLAAMMAIVSVPRVWAVDGDTFTAQTEDGVTLTFKVISETLKTCEVITCNDAQYTGAVTVPATANGYAVMEIGFGAFMDSKASSITLPNSIVALGSSTFWGCKNLQTIVVPASVTLIPNEFAYGCQHLSSVTIPEGVTKIDDSAFYGCTSLTDIDIPASVTEIGQSAFNGCTALDEIVLPGVTTIGTSAFYGCTALAGIDFPNVETIGVDAFMGCTSITEIVLPASLTAIGNHAFYHTNSLQRVEVKRSVPISIDAGCFENSSYAYPPLLVVPYGYKNDYAEATGWKRFTTIDDGSTFKATVDGVEMTFRMIGETACQVGDGENLAISTTYSGAVRIPESVNGIPVTKVANFAFSGCAITELTLPNTLTELGENSVQRCQNLAKVYALWTTPPEIPSLAFSATYDYATLYVPYESLASYQAANGWKSFHNIAPFSSDPTIIIDVSAGGSLYTFYKVISESDKTCQVGLGEEGSTAIPTTYAGDFTIPSSVNGYTVTKVGAYAFQRCSGITAMILPEGIKEIGDYAFAYATAMTSVSLPESLEKIGTGTFKYSGLTAVELPENSLNLGPAAFMGCSQLASVKLPSQITVLPNYLFENCYRLESIVIPNNVNTIGSSCFSNTALTSVLLPESLNYIYSNAFYCSNLKTVVSPLSQLPTLSGNPFGDFSSNATLYVPVGCKNLYSASIYWGQFHEIIDDDMVSMSPENIVIHFRVISEDDKTCEVYRGENTAAIDGYNNAHEGAVFVQMTVPASVQGYTVTRIGQHAFYGCTQVTGINLPSTIKEIGYQAFYRAGLRGGTFVLPEGLNHLDDHAFESSNVDNVILPSTLTAISNYAFKGDPFNTFIIPNTVESIGTQAFNQQGITGVTVVTVFRSTPLPIDADCFTPNSHSTLYVPAGSKAAYEQATGWNKFSNIVELDMGGSTGVKGDVNGDGSVTISDVTKVVSIILGSPSSATE